MIEEINDEILNLVKQKLNKYFSYNDNYDDIFGITAMRLGKQHPNYLDFFDDIEHIVKRHTFHNDIILNIPNEIQIVADSLIDSMVDSGIYKKLSKKNIIDYMFKTIKNYIEKSEFFFNEFQKDKKLFDE
tara:strand:+ start:883 stop:1272 length:390 start_codon:yes stop_codon:yes gene_type:complete